MAVTEHETRRVPSAAIGLNVALMVVLAVALVAGLQWIAYAYGGRADLTKSGVNSLSDGTVRMLKGLNQDIRLTSLYFKTDLEDQDQTRYRKAAADLLELYGVTNRGKVTVDFINPLQDHDKRKALVDRLVGIKRFAEQAEKHRAVVDAFSQRIVPAVGALMTDELGRIDALTGLSEKDNRLISQVKMLYERTRTDLESGAREITDALASEAPAYSAATAAIRRVYAQISQMLESVIGVSAQLTGAGDQFSPGVVSFFAQAESRYRPVLDDVKAQQDALGKLPRLELDDILRAIGPMSNAVVVESADDARVIEFRDMWPVSGGAGAGAARTFAGEQKLTAAILQLTEKSKPAVVFVRYGGPPLLMGGFMPGQPRGAFSKMRTRLEEVNFSVHEWDLASQETAPKIDPAPSRVIYVVMPPSPPPRGPMGQPSRQPPFSDKDLKKLTDAMGRDGRALFLAGYEMGQMGMPSHYGYNQYLESTWGVQLTDDRLLFKVEPVGVEKYQIYSSPILMTQLSYGYHPIVKQLGRTAINLPFVSPIEVLDKQPEGVTIQRLAWLAPTEGLWAVKDVQYYARQRASEFIVRNPEDYEGEFTVAVAGVHDNAKMVLIGSSEFANDRNALATGFVLTAQGLVARPLNPGNVTLLINSLHWLNDNTEWMNLGAPIDAATINIDRNSKQMTLVKAMVYVIWPGIFLLTGVVVWWTRRS